MSCAKSSSWASTTSSSGTGASVAMRASVCTTRGYWVTCCRGSFRSIHWWSASSSRPARSARAALPFWASPRSTRRCSTWRSRAGGSWCLSIGGRTRPSACWVPSSGAFCSGTAIPVGQQVRVDRLWCEVVGVLAPRSTGGRAGRIAASRDLDNVVIGSIGDVLPTSPAVDPTQPIDEVWIRVADGDDVATVAGSIERTPRPGTRRAACARHRRAAGPVESARSHAANFQRRGQQRRGYSPCWSAASAS